MNLGYLANLVLHSAIIAAALSITHASCKAVEPIPAASGETAPDAWQSDVRRGGVLQESFGYHRREDDTTTVKHPTIALADGWYGYGFPVKTHRWGWFGAQHYYPRVVWHRGYNGDHCRWSYRRGY